jgi:hypothetical protein
LQRDFPFISSGRWVAFITWRNTDSNASNNVGGGQIDRQDFLRDMGDPLGVGGLAASGRLAVTGVSSFAETGRVVATVPSAQTGWFPIGLGADLRGAALAYRRQYGDLFIREDLQSLPAVAGSPLALGALYGFNLSVNGERYQLRAQRIPSPDYDAAGGASFGLFRQNPVTGVWTEIAALRGGYGTTGEEVVFALPLEDIGAQNGGQLSAMSAFTAVGSYETGIARILDRIELSR